MCNSFAAHGPDANCLLEPWRRRHWREANNSQGASLRPPQRLIVFTGAGADRILFSITQGWR